MSPEWEAALEGFEKHLRESDRKPSTWWSYLQHARKLEGVCPAGPAGLRSMDLQAWIDGQHWSAATRHNVVVSVRTFYTWAVRVGLVDWSPAAGLAASGRKSGPAKRPVNPLWAEASEEFVAWGRAAGRSE